MFHHKSTVASKITVEVLGEDGQVKSVNRTTNIMTNFGLSHWSASALGTHIALGSGSRAEEGSVTSLASYTRNQLGSWSYSDTNNVDIDNGVMRTDHTLEVVFPVEVSAQNYSEMGINSNNQNELQTYALIRDPAGSPTAISVQAGEQVRVYYLVQFSTPLQNVVSKTMNGVLTTVTTVPLATGATNAVRLPNTPANATRYWAAGQPIPEPGVQPVGGTQGPRAATVTSGTYTQSLQIAEMNLAGGISLIRLGGTAGNVGIMVHFDPPIMKTSDFSMAVAVTSNLSNGDFYA